LDLYLSKNCKKTAYNKRYMTFANYLQKMYLFKNCMVIIANCSILLYIYIKEFCMVKKKVVLVSLLIFGLAVIHAQSGSFGEGLTWRFANGTLTISGNGAMPRYSTMGDRPWNTHIANITSIFIEDGITAIGNNAFSGAVRLSSVTVGTGVTSIGVYAFRGSGIKEFTIPAGVTELLGGAFAESQLETLYYNAANLRDYVIMDKPFNMTPALKTIIVGDSVRRIPNYIFFDVESLETVTIGRNVNEIGMGAFQSCNQISSLTLGESLSVIGRYAFSGIRNVRTLIIPDSVTYIRGQAFADCRSLTSLTLGSGLVEIAQQAFTNSALTEVTIPEGVTDIGTNAFGGSARLRTIYFNAENCKDFVSLDKPLGDLRALQTVVFGERVRAVPAYVLTGTTSLESVTIGSRASRIGNGAFSGCTDLTEIINRSARPQTLHRTTFYGVDQAFCTLNVSAASLNAYKAAAIWKDFQF
jgi:hypothetical protein